jgi:hypothetical protein
LSQTESSYARHVYRNTNTRRQKVQLNPKLLGVTERKRHAMLMATAAKMLNVSEQSVD